MQPVYWLAAVTLLAGCVVGLASSPPPTVARVVVLAMSCVTAVAVAIAFAFTAYAHPGEFWLAFASKAPVLLALAAAWGLLVMPWPANRRAVGMVAVAAAVACTISVSTWDQRTSWTRYVESGAASRDFASIIPQQASVYWDGGIEMLWLGLDRPSYFSCNQGSGVLFSRGTAMAYGHRRASLFPLKQFDD